MTIADIWRYGVWRHVAMGCTALVTTNNDFDFLKFISEKTITNPQSATQVSPQQSEYGDVT